MIDTDKYEGHTPAPWTIELGNIEEYGETDTVMSSEGEVAMNVMRQDVALLADAPLLLAELKRLRKIEQEHGRVIIDDWEHKPNGIPMSDTPYAHPEYGQPYVTVYLGGCEYVGLLRLYKNEDGKVIE